MYGKLSLVACVLVTLLLMSASGISAQQESPENPSSQPASPLTTVFTYQGRLKDTSGPVNNTCDFEFKLFASAGGSDQVGDSQPRNDVLVEDGYFTVDDLDFGAGAFQGEARWLEVAVRCPAGSGDFEVLAPRQALTAAPQALFAKRAPWSGLIGLPAGFADGVDNDTLYTAGGGLTLSGEQFSVDTSLIQARVDHACSAGSAIRVINQDGSVTCQSVSGAGGGDITAVYAGTGLSGGSEAGDATLSADPGYLQRRVSSSCAAGNAIRVINQDGSVTCQSISGAGGGDITAVYAGTGLLGGSEAGDATLSADPGYLQRRVSGSCTAGNAIRVINADGTVSCESDDNTTYSAGPGLTLNGTQFSVNFAGGGSASTASRTDHNHWSQSWSGSGTGLTLSGGSTGLFASGTTYGVRGESSSTVGVYGSAPSRGVSGAAYDSTGIGVQGLASATSGFNYGVVGLSYSSSGTGVYGYAARQGVLGEGTKTSGTTYGVVGRSASTSGQGVVGDATASSGTTYGVVGRSASTSGQGVVGDATASSGTTYGVVGYNASPAGYAGYFRNTSSGVALYALTDNGSGNIIEAWSSFTDREFSVDRVGNVRADGSYLGGGGDYAELLPGAAGLEPGDVLVIGPDGQLARSTQPFQTSVAGVYSTQPGFIAGAGDESSELKDQIPLAVVGIVPVKVTAENGPIQPGDLLTTSSVPGHAMRCGANPQVGTVIGKALEPLAEGIGVIKILVVLQ